MLLRGYRRKDVSSHGESFSPINTVRNAVIDEFLCSKIQICPANQQANPKVLALPRSSSGSPNSLHACTNQFSSESVSIIPRHDTPQNASSERSSNPDSSVQTPPGELNEVELPRQPPPSVQEIEAAGSAGDSPAFTPSASWDEYDFVNQDLSADGEHALSTLGITKCSFQDIK
jgi:hypothetical protein